MHTTDNAPVPSSRRRWRTVRQIAQAWLGVFTEPSLRGLIHRAEPHYDSRGELVPGNGLADSITRLGGKGGRVLIDEDGFAAWLEAGLVSEARLTRAPSRLCRWLNLDFDMKRRIVEPVDVGGVITAGTEPWETVDEFHAARDGLERWKKAQRRVLKTVQDYRDLRAWQAARPGQAASGSTAQSGRPPLVNLVLRAAARGALRLTKQPDRYWAAFITACGWAGSEQTVKDARRRGKLTLGQLKTLTPEEIDFIEALLSVSPAAEIEALTEPGSPAATAVAMTREFVSAFDFHRPDLPEPDEDDAPAGWQVALRYAPYSASATS